MSKIRVLIVDDAVVVRRMLLDLLSSDPAFEVVGTAPNGRIALAKIPQLTPDVVTLDLEMPEMDGLQTLTALRKTHPRLPVLMLSRFTQRGAAVTVDALTRGANDYFPLPDQGGDPARMRQTIREQLIPKIKLIGRANGEQPPAAMPVPSRGRSFSGLSFAPRPRVDIVAIGTSTGGPNALAVLLPSFPAHWPVPTVMVQHMPPVFTKHLADRLSVLSTVRVKEASVDDSLQAGEGWLAPGDHHMFLVRDGTTVRVGLNQELPENSCRPAVDVLFRSVADLYGPGALAVVLTGMGQDGLRGCERIREAGGQILVQDEASSVVWGMRGLSPGLAWRIKYYRLTSLGPEIVRRVQQGRSTSSAGFRAPIAGPSG